MIRIFLLVIATVLAHQIYLSLFLASPILRYVHLPALGIVACVLFARRAEQWWVAAASGFTLALFASSPFFVFPLITVAALLLTRSLYERFFTNRSVYGVAVLSIMSTTCFSLLSALLVFFSDDRSSEIARHVVRNLLWTCVGTLFVSILLFYISVLFSYGFKKTMFARYAHRRAQ